MESENMAKKRNTPFPKITRNIAKIILNVRNYFAKEKENQKREQVTRLLDRTCQATGISRKIINKNKSSSDLKLFPTSSKISRPKNRKVDPVFLPIIYGLLRDITIEDKKVPTLAIIQNKLLTSDFKSFDFLDYEPKFTWCKETLRKFMINSEIKYMDRKDHYDSARVKESNIELIDNYIDYIAHYHSINYTPSVPK